MKALILAAGKGDRLGRITESIPKPMLELNGKPVIEHNINMCKTAGVDEILINLHHLPEQIRKFIGDGSDFGVKVRYNYESELLGTAGAIVPFKDYLGNEAFFVIYGDNYVNFDLMELKLFHEKFDSDLSILFHWRKDISSSGLAIFNDNGNIVKFIEKPNANDKIGDWVNAGVYYIGNPEIVQLIKPFDDFGLDIFPKLIKLKFNIYGLKSEVKVNAIDTPEMLAKSVALYQK